MSFAKGFLGCLGVIAAGVFGLIVLGSLAANSGRSSGPTSPKTPLSDLPWITAPEMVQFYKYNEVAADQYFKGKSLAIKGTVDKIGKDILDTMYVSLSSGERYDFRSVQAFFLTIRCHHSLPFLQARK